MSQDNALIKRSHPASSSHLAERKCWQTSLIAFLSTSTQQFSISWSLTWTGTALFSLLLPFQLSHSMFWHSKHFSSVFQRAFHSPSRGIWKCMSDFDCQCWKRWSAEHTSSGENRNDTFGATVLISAWQPHAFSFSFPRLVTTLPEVSQQTCLSGVGEGTLVI